MGIGISPVKFVVDKYAYAPRVGKFVLSFEQIFSDVFAEGGVERVAEAPPISLAARKLRRFDFKAVDIRRLIHHKNALVGTVGDCVETPALKAFMADFRIFF